MMELQVNGRLRRPVAVAKVDEGGVTVRIDDLKNDEFWCEVRISIYQLRELVRAVDFEPERPIDLADLLEEPVEPVEDIPPVLDDATWTAGL